MERTCKDVLELFSKKWALVSAGKEGDYNTMTIGWGGLGTMWSRPVCSVYVKPIRYTYDYLEKYDYFTVSFYDESYKDDLMILGTKSGRDLDKVALTSLTPEFIEDSITFKEAVCTIVCKKIYYQDMIREPMLEEVVDKYYKEEEPHRMYIGEVVKIINNKHEED